MSFSINTNAGAMAAIRTLTETNRQLEVSQNRLNTGFKVSGAKDIASTFAIAQGLRSDIAAFKAVSESISFGKATANVALKASENVGNILSQIKEKVVQAQGSNVDRTAIQRDITSLVSQVTATVDAAQFNGVNLLDNVDPSLSVLAGLNRTDPSSAPTAFNITVNRQNLTAANLGISGINVANGSVTLTASADLAFADGDTISFTVGGNTTTFEFVDDPAADALTAAGNVAVTYDGALSAGENLAALWTSMRDEGFAVSFNSNGTYNITHNAGSVTASTDTFATGTLDATVNAAGNPAGALTTIENALTTAKTAMASFGTTVKQLETQASFVKELTDVLTEGVGILVDADLAEESAKLQSLQTRQQLGIQALSIANQAPSAILGLFR